MEEGMEKQVRESRRNIMTLISITLIISVVGCGLLGWMWVKTHSNNLQLADQNSVMTTDIEAKAKEIALCHDELEKLRARMEGIKDNDDLLKRDIFLYIDKKFQIIPRTVALDIAEQVLKFSKKETISPELIVGIIEVESSFNPMAISSKNARGLMQVMPEWAPKFGLKKVSDLHDIDTNIHNGIKVLKIHIEEGNGSISKGLYYYVGKSDSYASKVYEAMGKFVAFRSTVDDDDVDIEINGNGNGSEKPKVVAKPIVKEKEEVPTSDGD